MLHHILWVAFDFEKILWCQALQGVPVDISPLLGLCLLKTASVRVYWDGIRCGWWCQYTLLNDFELWDGIIVIILLIAQNCICWSLSLIWLLSHSLIGHLKSSLFSSISTYKYLYMHSRWKTCSQCSKVCISSISSSSKHILQILSSCSCSWSFYLLSYYSLL